ncbi:hypothetical protein AB4342_01305 [Vibrio breoganii]
MPNATLPTSVQIVGNALLDLGYWLDATDEAKSYIEEHLSDISVGDEILQAHLSLIVDEALQEHVSHITDEFCTPLYDIETVADDLDITPDALDPIPLKMVIASTDEDSNQYKRMSPEWFLKLDNVELVISEG